jgi:hypothetical protein
MSLHLDVSPQAEARFNSVAEERGIEPGQLFEEMLDSYLPPIPVDGDGPSIYEKFADLFGTIEGLPPDMSQNKRKYLKGFGRDPGEDR